MLKLKEIKSVYLDTNVYIYLFTNNPKYADEIEKTINTMEDNKVKIYTSPMHLVELLRKAHGKESKTIKETFLEIPNIHMIDITQELADKAAGLRERYGLKITESFHLATAVQENCDAIITNNTSFENVEELKVIPLDTLTQ